MKVELKLPRYGTNMEEGTIGRWLKAPGDNVTSGEPLCEIETEKVTTIYESPVSGRLIEIVAQEGDNAAVGGVLCRIDVVS
jgi:pyruvate/2-oxoglutarate dehydrogenase complex dihydrolipoamide acyltransferase (E2) component